MDALEESAEFLGSLEKFFQRTESTRVKYAYMEAFNRLILPVAGVHPHTIKLTSRLQLQKLIPHRGLTQYNLFTQSFTR